MTDHKRERTIGVRTLLFIIADVCFCLFFCPFYAVSASFDIQPIKIFFNARTRAEKLLIRNQSDGDLSLQVKAFRWVQDKEGNDVYEDTADIVFFPKILTMHKDEEKIIRIGINSTSGQTEKTYRVYVEEIPINSVLPEGATVRVILKVGVPVFMNPVRTDAKGDITSFLVQDGKARFKISNEGNLHFIVTSLHVKGRDNQGNEVFSKEFGGWYLLGGASRTYETAIPVDICNKLSTLDIAGKTDRFTLNSSTPVSKRMCTGGPN